MNLNITDRAFNGAKNIICEECEKSFNCEDCIVQKLFEKRVAEFKVDDVVVVVDPAYSVTKATDLFASEGLESFLAFYAYGHEPRKHCLYEIEAFFDSKDFSERLYVISEKCADTVGPHYLVTRQAIEKV